MKALFLTALVPFMILGFAGISKPIQEARDKTIDAAATMVIDEIRGSIENEPIRIAEVQISAPRPYIQSNDVVMLAPQGPLYAHDTYPRRGMTYSLQESKRYSGAEIRHSPDQLLLDMEELLTIAVEQHQIISDYTRNEELNDGLNP